MNVLGTKYIRTARYENSPNMTNKVVLKSKMNSSSLLHLAALVMLLHFGAIWYR